MEEKYKKRYYLTDEQAEYDPFTERHVKYPTTDLDTLIHLVKGGMGTGILAMPYAFKNIGLWAGIAGVSLVGFICGYCLYILVRCAHILCFRLKIPKMTYADIAEQSCLEAGPKMVKFSMVMRHTVNFCLCVDLFGCCCIYFIFFAKTLKQIVDYYWELNWDLRLWIAIITVPMLFLCLIRNLKFITPFSAVANVFILIGIFISFYYIFSDMPSPKTRVGVEKIADWPIFFGTSIFALECIGVLMPLENEMENPPHYIGCPSVLVIAQCFVVFLYMFLGFFGFLRYGPETEGSITLNLPVEHVLAQIAKILVGFAIYFTFMLQFYVALNIVWDGLKDKFAEQRQRIAEYILRFFLVLSCSALAILLPNLGPFISLIGAFALSILGLIVPAITELIVLHEIPGYGVLLWRLWKNLFLIIFGLVGLLIGTYVSVLELTEEFGTSGAKKFLSHETSVGFPKY